MTGSQVCLQKLRAEDSSRKCISRCICMALVFSGALLLPTSSRFLARPWCSRSRCLSESDSCTGLHLPVSLNQIISVYILLNCKPYQIGSSREFLNGTLLPLPLYLVLFLMKPLVGNSWFVPILAHCQEMLPDE